LPFLLIARKLHRETIKLWVVVGILFAFHVETKTWTVIPQRSHSVGHNVVSTALPLQEEPPGYPRTAQSRWQSSTLPPQTGAKKMTKLEAIIQPSRFGAVKAVLTELGIGGLAVSGVRGHGSHKGHRGIYRGRQYTAELLPKIKLEMVLPDDLVDSAMEAIRKTAINSSIGEEKIFVSKLEETIRARNRERGAGAL
jgi:nitrogen regulatory protein P-II 1